MWKIYLLLTSIWVMLSLAPFALAQCATDGDFIPNPIQACSFEELITNVSDYVAKVGGILAVVAIIFVGFKLILASVSSNQAELATAKKMFWYVLIGAAVVVGGAVLVHAVVNTITKLSG